jgi:hypothetical protein
MRLCNLTKMKTANDGTRSLVEPIMSLDVIAALRDWTRRTRVDGMLKGDLALCYHVKPRMTDSICFLVEEPADIPRAVAAR